MKKKYFNIHDYLNKLNIDYTKDISVLIITAVRNMGKSYSVWEFIEKDIWEKFNHTKKVAIIRTNEKKMLESEKAFNTSYIGKYKSIKGIIYKQSFDTKGREIEKERIEIGRFVNIMNEHNYRSGAGQSNFTNYILAFWDEFNESEQIEKDLYKKFCMLYSTILRQNNPFNFIIIGNKINANNDIFIKLELDTDIHNSYEDYVQELISPISNQKIGYYVDIGYNTFKDVNKDSIVNAISEFDYDTNNLFNVGKFLNKQAANVVVYRKFIEPTKRIKFYLTYKELCIEYGSFGSNGEFIYFHQIPEIPENTSVVALDLMGYMCSQTARKLFDNDEYVELCDLWANKIKQKRLYFTSFDLKLEIEKYIIMISQIWKE